jgi:hypothetical protein
VEGLWTYDNWTIRHGVKLVKYMMMQNGKYYQMDLDTCHYGSKDFDQASCAKRWVVRDPLALASASYSAAQLTPTTVMSTTVCTSIPGEDKPIAPPIGPARWVVDCQNGQFKHIDVTLAATHMAVKGQWDLQRCGTQSITSILNMSTGLTTQTGTKPYSKTDEAVAKADILRQMDMGVKVTTQGAQQSMVNILTSQFNSALKFSQPGHLASSLTPTGTDICYWVWKWSITGPVLSEANANLQFMSQSAHAWTPSSTMKPLCYPGFATDFPKYQSCSPHHKIQTTVK